MYPKPIEDYFAPPTVDAAIELLDRHGADAKALAGGQSLLPLLKGRFVETRFIVDLNRAAELTGLAQVSAGGQKLLRIGALVRHQRLATDPSVRAAFPSIAEAARVIGDVQIRNRGTIGGSLSHADPAADLPVPLLTLGAVVVVRGPGGERRAPAADLFLGPLMTTLAPNEILTAVEVPWPAPGTGAGYAKQTPIAGGFAVINIGAALTVEAGAIARASCYVGGVMPMPQRAARAEQVLLGQTPSPDLFAEAAAIMAGEIETHTDHNASAEYRKTVVGRYGARVLARAAARAEEGVAR